MTRVCDVTGAGPMSGNHVSHANNKRKRRFLPNLHALRIWVDSEKRYVKLNVSSKGLRLINKLGADEVLRRIKARKAGKKQ